MADTCEPNAYKVLVVGTANVGKTSVVRRYTKGVFDATYKATLGVDFAMKELDLPDPSNPEGRPVRSIMQLWDIGGQDKNPTMTRVYLKGGVAAIVVAAANSKYSFEQAIEWQKDVERKLPEVPVVLIVNKSDVPWMDYVMNESQVAEFAKLHGFAACFWTSAATGANVEEAFHAVAMLVSGGGKVATDGSKDGISFNNTMKRKRSRCC